MSVQEHPIETFEFSEDDLRLISAQVPESARQRRRSLLPKILNDWAANDLQEYFVRDTGQEIRLRDARQDAAFKAARNLYDALNGLKEYDVFQLAWRMHGWPREENWASDWTEVEKTELGLHELQRFLSRIDAACRDKLEKTRGHPPNDTAFFIMLDVQTIYEWLTGQGAERVVGNKDSGRYKKEIGQFTTFAGAVWRAIYKWEKGFPAAVKNWATAKKKHPSKTPSAVLANCHMRHPEWTIFNRQA